MAGIWVRSLVASVACVAFACSGSGDGGDDTEGAAPSGGRGGSSGGTSSEPRCVPTECECPNGLPSTTVCPSEECACDQCPEYDPDVAPFSIEACGGEPFGTWRATESEVSGFDFKISNTDGGSITCEGYVESFSGGQYLVEFADGGVGNVFLRTPDTVVLFENSCLERIGGYCEYFDDYECEALDCGLCRCSFTGATLNGETTWSRDESILTLRTLDSTDELDYCVGGAEMVQVNQSGNLRYTLEKVYLSGAPLPCDERTLETCHGTGCSLGQCTGTGDCDSEYSESSCLERQGCSWDPDVCHGEAWEACGFDDYARGAPGCEMLTGTPTCSGTPERCELQPECAAEGCSEAAACEGGEHSCTSTDDGVPGCVCEFGDCEGTFDCASLTDAVECRGAGLTNYCFWNQEGCVGTPTACSELTADQCQSTAGCVLQAE